MKLEKILLTKVAIMNYFCSQLTNGWKQICTGLDREAALYGEILQSQSKATNFSQLD